VSTVHAGHQQRAEEEDPHVQQAHQRDPRRHEGEHPESGHDDRGARRRRRRLRFRRCSAARRASQIRHRCGLSGGWRFCYIHMLQLSHTES